MSYDYEPQEGVDYLVDLYAVIGAARDTDPDQLKSIIRDRTREYHPDRLEGLAPEFRSKGEQMARLLNRARGILLDPENRSEYDIILNKWDGPVSDSGTPVITMDSYTKAMAATLDPEELEATFQAQREKLVDLTGYKPGRLGLLERMVAEIDSELPDDLRGEYEEALLEADRILAIQEAERAKLLGLDISERRYEATLDYASVVAGEIEASRGAEQKRLYMIALGGVPTRLALLAGVEIEDRSEDSLPARPEDVQLPRYFDLQAEKVLELAKERESILERRLANFRVNYPAAELQIENHNTVAIGVVTESGTTWFCVYRDPKTDDVTTIELDETTQAALDAERFEEAISTGKNVITFTPLEQINLTTLFNEALTKHFNR